MTLAPYYQTALGTLYHGDCLEVMRGLSDASVNLVLTDPPYGHNNNNGDLIHNREKALGQRKAPDLVSVWERACHGKGLNVSDSRPILNDGPEANDLFRACLSEWKRLLVKSGCCCCCCGGGGGPDPQFARWSLWLDEVLSFKHAVVWDKGGLGMGWHYRRNYEMVLVAERVKGGAAWYDKSRKISNVVRIPKIIPQASEHPTAKPTELFKFFLRLHTQPGDLVLDPFMGGGPVAAACEELGRRWIGIELDERWCELTAKRLQQPRQRVMGGQ